MQAFSCDFSVLEQCEIEYYYTQPDHGKYSVGDNCHGSGVANTIDDVLFSCSIVRMPEKLTVYTTLVGLLNAKNYNAGGEVGVLVNIVVFST